MGRERLTVGGSPSVAEKVRKALLAELGRNGAMRSAEPPAEAEEKFRALCAMDRGLGSSLNGLQAPSEACARRSGGAASRILLEAGAPPEIWTAADAGNADHLARCEEAGVDFRSRDPEGRQGLEKLFSGRNVEAAPIGARALGRLSGAEEFHALVAALDGNSEAGLRVLREIGCLPEVRAGWAAIALVQHPGTGTGALRFVVGLGERPGPGKPPSAMALRFRCDWNEWLPTAASSCRSEKLAVALAAWPDLAKAQDCCGRPLLACALAAGNVGGAEVLLRAGADFDEEWHSGKEMSASRRAASFALFGTASGRSGAAAAWAVGKGVEFTEEELSWGTEAARKAVAEARARREEAELSRLLTRRGRGCRVGKAKSL